MTGSKMSPSNGVHAGLPKMEFKVVSEGERATKVDFVVDRCGALSPFSEKVEIHFGLLSFTNRAQQTGGLSKARLPSSSGHDIWEKVRFQLLGLSHGWIKVGG